MGWQKYQLMGVRKVFFQQKYYPNLPPPQEIMEPCLHHPGNIEEILHKEKLCLMKTVEDDYDICTQKFKRGGYLFAYLPGAVVYNSQPNAHGNINPSVNLRAAVINSNLTVSPRNIIIHTTYQPHNMRVYNHE